MKTGTAIFLTSLVAAATALVMTGRGDVVGVALLLLFWAVMMGALG